MLRYCSTAGALGVGWFVVLLIPRTTREWLLAAVPQNLVCLVIASIIVAVACGLANLHDTISLYLMGLTATTVSFFVVIPYGLLCQHVMNSISRSRAA